MPIWHYSLVPKQEARSREAPCGGIRSRTIRMRGMTVQMIHVVGTCDTKGEEIAWLRDLIVAAGQPAVIVDLGTRAPAIVPDIPARHIAACHPDGADAVLGGTDRGAAVSAMGNAFAAWCSTHTEKISGIIAVGGGGGTSIACAGMRELPYGVPKLMVSTLASGDTAPFIGTSDIAMIPAVTDLAGLNRLSRVILSNAAHALVGAVTAPTLAPSADLPALGGRRERGRRDGPHQRMGRIRQDHAA